MTQINRIAEASLNYMTLKRVLDYNQDTGDFYWKIDISRAMGAGSKAGTTSFGYKVIAIHGISYFAHRLAWFYIYSNWPMGIIDHIDRNRANNAIANLRDTNYSVNNSNKPVSQSSISGHKGVYYNKPNGAWYVRLRVNKKLIFVGSFDNLNSAVIAKEKAEKNLGIHPSNTST